MDIRPVINLFNELNDEEVLRIELVNGTKIYCLPTDSVYETLSNKHINITKRIKKDKIQRIIIDENAIVLICTMSRQTYDLKLNRGELYV